jgi:hypothetical protein
VPFADGYASADRADADTNFFSERGGAEGHYSRGNQNEFH